MARSAAGIGSSLPPVSNTIGAQSPITADGAMTISSQATASMAPALIALST